MIGRKIPGAGDSKSAKAEESESEEIEDILGGLKIWASSTRSAKRARTAKRARRERRGRRYGSKVKVWKANAPAIILPVAIKPETFTIPGKNGADPVKISVFDCSVPYKPKIRRGPLPEIPLSHDVNDSVLKFILGGCDPSGSKVTEVRKAERSPAGPSHGSKVMAGKAKCAPAGPSLDSDSPLLRA